jgi:TldD protein
MREYTDRALNLAQVQGASYADIRIVHQETQDICVKNGVVQKLAMNGNQGFGVRVVADGAWGFASSHLLTPAEIDRVTALAVTIAKASALAKIQDVQLGPPEKHVDTYHTPIKQDPFAVPLNEKISLLLEADKEARAVKGVKVAESCMTFVREKKTFASTEESYIEQEITESGPPGRTSVPQRGHHRHPGRSPAGPAGARILWSPHRAGPGFRHRGLLCRDQLPDAR